MKIKSLFTQAYSDEKKSTLYLQFGPTNIAMVFVFRVSASRDALSGASGKDPLVISYLIFYLVRNLRIQKK
jgi:hypothetical protein